MNKIILTISAFALLISSTAYAKPYIEIIGGVMPHNREVLLIYYPANEGADFLDRDSKSYVFGARAGFEVYEYFAVEAGYIDNGVANFKEELITKFDTETLVTEVNVRSKSVQLGIKGILPLSQKFSLNAKGGLALWQIWDGDALKDSASDVRIKGNDPYFGVGAAFKFHENIAVGIDYTYLKMTNSTIAYNINHTAQQISASLKFQM